MRPWIGSPQGEIDLRDRSGLRRPNRVPGRLSSMSYLTFLSAYPEIEVEFVLDTRLVDIVAAGFDAGIRVLDDVPRDMIAVRFGPDMRFVAVASPEYLSRHEAPTSPRDLTQHRCVRFRFESGALYKWHLEQRGRAYSLDVAGPITVSNLNLAVDAALAGLGIAWIPEERVAEHLANGRLVQLLNKWSPAIPGLCLYHPGIDTHQPRSDYLLKQYANGQLHAALRRDRFDQDAGAERDSGGLRANDVRHRIIDDRVRQLSVYLDGHEVAHRATRKP